MSNNQFRAYSTSSDPGQTLHPEWVSGFVDAEGCFSVIVVVLSPLPWSWTVPRPGPLLGVPTPGLGTSPGVCR